MYETVKCEDWALAGECENNQYWMSRNCPLSCRKCQLANNGKYMYATEEGERERGKEGAQGSAITISLSI